MKCEECGRMVLADPASSPDAETCNECGRSFAPAEEHEETAPAPETSEDKLSIHDERRKDPRRQTLQWGITSDEVQSHIEQAADESPSQPSLYGAPEDLSDPAPASRDALAALPEHDQTPAAEEPPKPTFSPFLPDASSAPMPVTQETKSVPTYNPVEPNKLLEDPAAAPMEPEGSFFASYSEPDAPSPPKDSGRSTALVSGIFDAISPATSPSRDDLPDLFGQLPDLFGGDLQLPSIKPSDKTTGKTKPSATEVNPAPAVAFEALEGKDKPSSTEINPAPAAAFEASEGKDKPSATEVNPAPAVAFEAAQGKDKPSATEINPAPAANFQSFEKRQQTDEFGSPISSASLDSLDPLEESVSIQLSDADLIPPDDDALVPLDEEDGLLPLDEEDIATQNTARRSSFSSREDTLVTAAPRPFASRAKTQKMALPPGIPAPPDEFSLSEADITGSGPIIPDEPEEMSLDEADITASRVIPPGLQDDPQPPATEEAKPEEDDEEASFADLLGDFDPLSENEVENIVEFPFFDDQDRPLTPIPALDSEMFEAPSNEQIDALSSDKTDAQAPLPSDKTDAQAQAHASKDELDALAQVLSQSLTNELPAADLSTPSRSMESSPGAVNLQSTSRRAKTRTSEIRKAQITETLKSPVFQESLESFLDAELDQLKKAPSASGIFPAASTSTDSYAAAVPQTPSASGTFDATTAPPEAQNAQEMHKTQENKKDHHEPQSWPSVSPDEGTDYSDWGDASPLARAKAKLFAFAQRTKETYQQSIHPRILELWQSHLLPFWQQKMLPLWHEKKPFVLGGAGVFLLFVLLVWPGWMRSSGTTTPKVPVSALATLDISTSPSGASIIIDGTDTGQKTPAKLQLPSGAHTLKLHKKGYLPRIKPLNALARQSLMLDFALQKAPKATSRSPKAPSFAFLSVSSAPANAQIWINGKYTNKHTPATLKIPAGGASLKLVLSQHQPYTRKLIIPANQQSILQVDLKPLKPKTRMDLGNLPPKRQGTTTPPDAGSPRPTPPDAGPSSPTTDRPTAPVARVDRPTPPAPDAGQSKAPPLRPEPATLHGGAQPPPRAQNTPPVTRTDRPTPPTGPKPTTPIKSPTRWISSGAFWMGYNKGRSNEKPMRMVLVSGFRIDQFEVTVEAYQRCVNAGVCKPSRRKKGCNAYDPKRAKHPINCVSWYQAKRYCRWIKRRLPTEAQWEKAARGASTRRYPWGNRFPQCNRAHFRKCRPKSTSPVGGRQRGRSSYRVHDMAGNVWEWVRDRYSKNFYRRASSNNPYNGRRGSYRVMRGGGFSSRYYKLRVTYRSYAHPSHAGAAIGFRCAR